MLIKFMMIVNLRNLSLKRRNLLKTIDFHLAFFSGFRYFFNKSKVGIQTELALGYNMNALKMGAIWKL